MTTIQQLMEKQDWSVTIEVDPNDGGDGTRVRFFGDTHSFRRIAAIFTAMADMVDNPDHSASETGCHLAFNPDDLPQLQIKNASILTLNCLPT
ncbi:MAG: hypothetical protein GY903_29560 [Fuerstiella sp.]|nr:hypothetical protein [Fuerstiella sp.]MCP4858643.1 hypothetical protein [Fuerstiella sp.]